jgi:hypothetical protein
MHTHNKNGEVFQEGKTGSDTSHPSRLLYDRIANLLRGIFFIFMFGDTQAGQACVADGSSFLTYIVLGRGGKTKKSMGGSDGDG